MALTLALFDMAATTVDDTIDGCPYVAAACRAAVATPYPVQRYAAL